MGFGRGLGVWEGVVGGCLVFGMEFWAAVWVIKRVFESVLVCCWFVRLSGPWEYCG